MEASTHSNFEYAYKVVIQNEGGYVDHPNDPGGETYKGIARKSHPNWSGWKIIDDIKTEKSKKKIKIKHNEQFQNVNLDAAVKSFYKDKFWSKIHGGQIKDKYLAAIMFDSVVNHGKGAQLIQEAAVEVYKQENGGKGNVVPKVNSIDFKADNKFGNDSLTFVNSLDSSKLHDQIKVRRRRYYKALINKDSKLKSFEKGWNNRIDHFPTLTAGSSSK